MAARGGGGGARPLARGHALHALAAPRCRARRRDEASRTCGRLPRRRGALSRRSTRADAQSSATPSAASPPLLPGADAPAPAAALASDDPVSGRTRARALPVQSPRAHRPRPGRLGEGTHRGRVAPLDSALRLQPGDPLVEFNAGTAHLGANRPDAAQLLEQAAKHAPPGLAADAFYNLGNARLETKDAQAAIDAYKSALRAQSDLPDAKRNLELALRLLEEQQRQQEQQQKDSQENKQNQEQKPGGGQGQGQKPDQDRAAEARSPAASRTRNRMRRSRERRERASRSRVNRRRPRSGRCRSSRTRRT